MLLLTPLKKVPFEGHFSGGLNDEPIGRTSISRAVARCCTIAAMGSHKNSGLQARRPAFGMLVIAGLPSVAWAGTAVRPDSAQLLAAVCVGALIVLVAVAIAQRRRTPTSAPPVVAAAPRASDVTANQIGELQAILDGRERDETPERLRLGRDDDAVGPGHGHPHPEARHVRRFAHRWCQTTPVRAPPRGLSAAG